MNIKDLFNKYTELKKSIKINDTCTDTCTDTCDYCIGCIDCNNCIGCTECYNCNNCNNCNKCDNCNNCTNCILCIDLKNVTSGYWLINKKVTEEVYNEARALLKAHEV